MSFRTTPNRSHASRHDGTVAFVNAVSDAEALRLAGRWEEALEVLDAELARDLRPEARAATLLAVARTLNDRSTFGATPDEARSEAVLGELEDLARERDDDELLAAAHDLRGRALHARFLADRSAGEPEGELELFERARELRRPDDARGIAESLFHIGLVHQVVRGDGARSERYFEESYLLARDARDDVLRSYAIRHLGWTRQERGDVEGARAAFEESLRLRERAGFLPGVGAAALALAEFESEHGRLERAGELLMQAREVFESVGMQRFLGFADEVERSLDASAS
jgi:tetratricopeptide (TPR) repeat protein